MKNKILFCYFFVFLSFISFSCQYSFKEIQDEFQDFIHKFDKQYKNESEEFYQRFDIFMHNVRLQEQLKTLQPPSGVQYGVTKFSDLTPAEFKDWYLSDLINKPDPLGTKYQSIITPAYKLKNLKIPAKLDWRHQLSYSIISPIKNQKKCGACWAFSTVETLESMYSLQTGSPPPNLSVQEVIDCASNNYGCKGGDTCRAFKWMVQDKVPMVSESIYPLTDESNFCKIQTNTTKGPKVYAKNFTCNTQLVGNEDKILGLLQEGPVAASVDATTWSNYQGGIIQYHCDDFVNHAIQIVGYDMSGEVPYYIVRNSWGTDFGHKGYIYIKIGENVCGIAKEIATVAV